MKSVRVGNPFAIGTAGATALVLHTVYLPLALKGTVPSEVIVTGGTHNDQRTLPTTSSKAPGTAI